MNRYPVNERRSYKKALLPTGEIITGVSRANLRKNVVAHLRAKGALESVANFESYFANAICAAMPPERAALECKYVDDSAPAVLREDRVLRTDDVWRFVRSMTNWVSSGGGMDSQDAAERRAQICAQCPYNVDVAGCSWCSGLVTASLSLLSGRSTALDSQLKHCKICGCANRAAVHFPLTAADQTLEYPAWCWKKELASGAPLGAPQPD